MSEREKKFLTRFHSAIHRDETEKISKKEEAKIHVTFLCIKLTVIKKLKIV